MNINVFLLCFNESALLPHTIKHYKKYLPSCKITIYDNESTDNSVEIAKSLGCSVISWNSNNIINDFEYLKIKNNCWKLIETGWIIMADMDEFLCVTEDNLMMEMKSGVSLLNITGYDIIGESATIDLSDINLQEIKKYVVNHLESKRLCFLREKINEMNYNVGAHSSQPTGTIKYSSNNYINKHMSYIGLPFIINKNIERYKRSHDMRKHNMCVHYSSNIDNITDVYNEKINNCYIMN
jgi:hypothetical protein